MVRILGIVHSVVCITGAVRLVVCISGAVRLVVCLSGAVRLVICITGAVRLVVCVSGAVRLVIRISGAVCFVVCVTGAVSHLVICLIGKIVCIVRHTCALLLVLYSYSPIICPFPAFIRPKFKDTNTYYFYSDIIFSPKPTFCFLISNCFKFQHYESEIYNPQKSHKQCISLFFRFRNNLLFFY